MSYYKPYEALTNAIHQAHTSLDLSMNTVGYACEYLSDLEKVKLALTLLEGTAAVFPVGEPTQVLQKWIEHNEK
jgi:hypothetical protein